MNAFWWNHGSTGRGIRWLSWDKLCDAKEGGGLGFKKLRDFNIAMLAKQGWRLINNSNPLVTQLMQARYFPDKDFLNANLGSNPSYLWRSILEGQNSIRQGCRRSIGNGRSTRVWQVPWLPCRENGYITTPMPEQLKDIQVQGFLNDSQTAWDMEVVQDICNDRDSKLIQQIPIPMQAKEDSWLWLFEAKGQFSVRSCYRNIQGERVYTDGQFWRKLWSLKLPGKVLNFLWRTSRNVLPTASALVGKYVNMSPMCCWCQRAVENTVHVLFGCCFAQSVWHELGLHHLVVLRQEDTALEVFKRIFQMGSTEQCVMIGLFCWSLWTRRNKWLWEKINMSNFGIKSMAFNMLADWKRAREPLQIQSDRVNADRRWCKPPPGWVKVNVDAACKQGERNVKLGCVVRDDAGHFLRARTQVVNGSFLPREAEALSLKEALSWVNEWRNSKCIFESDAKLLVEAVQGTRGTSYFDTIAENCSELLKHFDEVLLVFIHRSANQVAHLLARGTSSLSGLQEWFSTIPDSIACNLAFEEL